MMAKFEADRQIEEQAKLKELFYQQARQMAIGNIELLKPVDAEVLATVEAHPLGGLRGLNFAIWMYFQGMVGNLPTSDIKIVLRTIEAMHNRGVDINSFYSTGITAAHLLADCHGEKFGLVYTDNNKTHKEILLTLIDFGLDVNVKDHDQQSPHDFAKTVEDKHGLGTSMFLQVYKPWAMNKKMQGMLDNNSSSSTKKVI